MAAVPRDFTDRIRDLERQVRELTSAASRRPAMTQVSGGVVTITDTGAIQVVDDTGRLRVHIGLQAGGKTLQVWDATGALVLSQ
ncbi:hypothetical protein AB0P37_08570 [Streptomyces antimycoticus]|uniref:hypothetical protein n=1 Tax=Streptomyces antimycoticus TaxID=68175 RepID=UPI0034218BA9